MPKAKKQNITTKKARASSKKRTEIAVVPAPKPDTPDFILVQAARDLVACDEGHKVLGDSSPEVDCYNIYGWPLLDSKRTEIVAIIVGTSATSGNGLRAKAIALQQDSVQANAEEMEFISENLASDILAIFPEFSAA